VQATAILLYAGGALRLLSALVGLDTTTLGGQLNAIFSVLFGTLYLVLARQLQLRRRWARTAVFVLCGIGLALGLLRLAGAGRQAALFSIASPLVYLILLLTPSTREWFRQEPPAEPAT